MNTHIEKAMELRSETPMVNNCTQAIMRVYADELGINEDMAAAIAACLPQAARPEEKGSGRKDRRLV